jgi:hypothetical protein
MERVSELSQNLSGRTRGTHSSCSVKQYIVVAAGGLCSMLSSPRPKYNATKNAQGDWCLVVPDTCKHLHYRGRLGPWDTCSYRRGVGRVSILLCTVLTPGVRLNFCSTKRCRMFRDLESVWTTWRGEKSCLHRDSNSNPWPSSP